MRFRMRTCLAVMGAVAMLGAFGADSATSQPGVIDSRLCTRGRAAATPVLDARSGQAAASVDVFNIDTATSIGTLIMFR